MTVIANQNQTHGKPPWTIRQIVGATLVVALISVSFWMVYRFNFVLFYFLAAIMIHIAMRPIINHVRRLGPRGTSAILLSYGLVVSIVALGFILIVPTFAQQLSDLGMLLPQRYSEMRGGLIGSSSDLLHNIGLSIPLQMTSLIANPRTLPNDPSTIEAAMAWLRYGIYAIFILFVMFMLALYWTLDGEKISYRLLMRLSPERRESTRTLIEDVESKVAAFYQGQLILCAFVGGLSTVAYLLIGLPNALVLGVISFILEAVPMVGPILGAVPALIVALPLGADKLVWVVVALIVIQQVENNILVPRVMDRAVGVNAIVSILSITAFSLLYGIVGAILAIPLAAILQIFVDRWVMMISRQQVVEGLAQNVDIAPQTQVADRDELSVLRLNARELALDVRKQLRQRTDTPDDSGVHPVEDLIESIAAELDGYLSRSQKKPSAWPEADLIVPPAAPPVAPPPVPPTAEVRP